MTTTTETARTTHNIPTTPSQYATASLGSLAARHKGHFESDAIVLIEGATREGGPGGWGVGGWGIEGEGRLVHEGPMVKGPIAFLFGLASVIDRSGGTGRINSKAEAEGRLFRVKAGDDLVIDGVTYRLSLDKRGYPSLTQVTITVALAIELPEDFPAYVYVTAMEGGVQMWASVLRYRWKRPNAAEGASVRDDMDLWGFQATIQDNEDDENKKYVVDYAAIGRGLRLACVHAQQPCEGNDGKPAAYATRIVAAMLAKDAGMIDAELADCVVQLGVMGDVVYG